MNRVLMKQRKLYSVIFLLILTISMLFPANSNLSTLGERQTSVTDSQKVFYNDSNSQSLQVIQDLLNDKINTSNDFDLNLITKEAENSDLSNEVLSIVTSSGESLKLPIPVGVNTIQSFSVKGDTSIFINDQRGGDKLEVHLRDYTFLWQEGYIIEGNIRVIVLPGSPIQNNAYAVRLLSESDISLLTSQLLSFKGTINSTFSNFPFLTVELPFDELFKLAEQDFVAHIFLDEKVFVSLDQSVPIIKEPATWQELETQFGSEVNGTDMRIAILDTGIDNTHPDLDDLDDNPVTTDPKVIAEACFTGEAHTWDGYGHGTHCASIAAGTGEASSYTYVGVAPGALLLNGKVLNDGGSGYDSWIINGIEWAVNQSADVISMSLGKDINGDGTDPLSLAIDWATDQGIVCAVAAGNAGGGGMFSVGMPAVAKKAITVGSTTKADEISSFSSQGPTTDNRIKPDVCAPGSNIVAARATGTSMGSPLNENYTSASGTSMATPHVAGAMALILEIHPQWNPLMVKSALMGNAEILTGERLWRQGAGRIDLCNATNTTLLIIEPSISLGKLNYGEIFETTLIIMNLANTATTIDLSNYTSCDGNETNYVNLNTTHLTIPANTNASISLEVGPLDENAPEGWYEGWINISCSQNNKTAPYMFISMSSLSVRIFDTDNSTPIYATVALVTYPNLSLIDIQSTYEGDPGSSIGSAEFNLKAGDYAICAQSAWIKNRSWSTRDYSRMFMLEKNISVLKASSINISLSLVDAQVHSIPTVDSLGENLIVHSYAQYFCGGPQTWHASSYFQVSEWYIGGSWFGIDLNTSHLIFYSTNYTPPDRLCEALGYYASNSLFSEIYLVPLKYWNVSTLPSTLSCPESDYAKYYVYYDMPETYPENGLNNMNAFWFTWDHMGGFQIWYYDTHSVPAGINATYYLAPRNGTYFGKYMSTYKGWPEEIAPRGPLQEWTIGHNSPYPQIPLEKGEIGNMTLGNFSFSPYHPNLNLTVLDLGTEFLLNLTGDIWKDLSWLHMWWPMMSRFQSPFPQYYANYSLYVNGALFDQGLLNGEQGHNGEPFVHDPPTSLDVDWNGINETWNIPGDKILLQLTLPSLATLYSHTTYNLTFNLSGVDITPPIINGIFCPTNYTPGQDIFINFTAFDVGLGIASHSLNYSFNNGSTWQVATYVDPYYLIPCEAADALTILINVTDQAGNSLQYFSNPIALCSKVKLNVPPEIFAFTGDPITISGNLTSLEGQGLARMAVSLINDSISYEMTNENGIFSFTLKAIELPGDYTINISSASVGLYDREEVSITLRVTIDTEPPSWVEIPTDQLIEFGENFLYDLNATDLAGISTWWLNDTVNFDIDANGIINATFLPVGVYRLQVWVNDTHNLIQSANFSVTVKDTTAPSWGVTPNNQTLQYGEALDYQLSATDLSGIDHWIINDTIHFDISSTGRLTNITILDPGTYDLNITAYDPYDNNLSITITITVQDTVQEQSDGFPVLVILLIIIFGSTPLLLLSLIIILRRRRKAA